MRSVRQIRRPLAALVALLVALVVGYLARGATSDGGASRTPSASTSGSSGTSSTSSTSSASSTSSTVGAVALSTLPPQAAATVRLIESGGPFPFPRNDGVIFHDNERHLPREPDGYYREYTVPTPGEDDRGARRIVLGRDGTYWWTGDHYDSFQRIEVDR